MIRKKMGFEELLPKQQFLELVEQSDNAIQRWYYEKGSAGELPSTIDSFIEEMKIFIAGKDVDDMERFREESWSEYIYRLKLSCTNKKDNDISIRKKLRSMHAPRALECILFSIDDLTKIIERVKEFENHKIGFKSSTSCRDNRSFKKNSMAIFTPKIEKLKKYVLEKRIFYCYKCGKAGHMARDCNLPSNNLFNDNENHANLDMRIVRINRKTIKVFVVSHIS
ncbi:hypothetical protein DMUE_5439 [Dictyocoela muelleri]|nr:hypothetical protein DMUE_5439 [Dictyocoela muelleri]